MTKKIKSIKLKMPLLGNPVGTQLQLVPVVDSDDRVWGIKGRFWIAETDILKSSPEFFEVEYYSIMLKRPDGSLITEPGNWVKCCFILQDSERYRFACPTPIYFDPERDIWLLREGRVFLPEDFDLAEKKAQMLTKQFEISCEIDELNAEQGWNEKGWAERQSTYFLEKLENGIIVCSSSSYLDVGHKKMSQRTAEIILSKYSQDELMQYLGIII